MSHKFEWFKPSPFFAYSEFKWDVFNKEQAKLKSIVPFYYNLPKGMFTKFLVKYINWMKKNGTYEELIAISQECYDGEDNYPDWLYYELSIINPNEGFTYFNYINIFSKAVLDAYKTHHIVYEDIKPEDRLRSELKERLLSICTNLDALEDSDIKDLQTCLSRFVS